MLNIPSLILIVLLILAGASGYKRGLLADGRILISNIMGILAVPIISPHIERLVLLYTPLGTMAANGRLFLVIGSYATRLLVFYLSMTLVRTIIMHLLTIDELPAPIGLANKIGGIFWGALKIFCIVWILDLIAINSPAPIPFMEFFRESSLYIRIASLNPLPWIFTEFVNL